MLTSRLSLRRNSWRLQRSERTTAHLLLAHRSMGICLLHSGDIAKSRRHLEQAIALYDPAEHRPLATRFGVDAGVIALSYRSWANWLLGCPKAALADSDRALGDAREIGQVATLMIALGTRSFNHVFCGNYAEAKVQADELVALADEKGAPYWKAAGKVLQGQVLALTGKASDAVQTITSALTAYRSTGATGVLPFYLSFLATAYAELDQFDEAWRCIGD